MRRFLSCAVAVALACIPALPVCAADTAALSVAGQATTQLPRNVRPTHYTVLITPDAPKLQFKGTAFVSVDVLQSTRQITLNAIDMDFARVGFSSTHADAHIAPTSRRASDTAIANIVYRIKVRYEGLPAIYAWPARNPECLLATDKGKRVRRAQRPCGDVPRQALSACRGDQWDTGAGWPSR